MKVNDIILFVTLDGMNTRVYFTVIFYSYIYLSILSEYKKSGNPFVMLYKF